MKFQIERRTFLSHLNILNRAITAHSPKPILCGFYISLEKERLRMIGADAQIAIESILYPDGTNGLQIDLARSYSDMAAENLPSSFVVEAKYLLKIISDMSDDFIEAELLDEASLQIRGDRDYFNLRIMKGEDYPLPHFQDPATSFKLPSKVLTEIVEQVSFAASPKDFRSQLMGVNLLSSKGKLIAAATDAYRLARKVIEIEGLPEFNITVPVKCLLEAARSSGEDKEMLIKCNEKVIQFLFEQSRIQGQLYDGTYPDINKIFPKSFSDELETRAVELMRKLNLSSVYSNNQVSVCKMECSPEKISVTSFLKELGNSDQYLDEFNYSGEPLKITFNANFMLDALKGLHCQDKVKLQFISDKKPIRITNPQDPNLEMLVVPLRSH